MKQRNKRGSVGIETKQGKLRLRLPRTIADVNARYISTGLDDTPENRRKAQVTAWQIEEDINHGSLDPTLTRYKFNQPTIIVTRSKDVPDLRELWVGYCRHRQPVVAVTTYKHQYLGYYTNHINRLPSHSIADANYIRQHIVSTLSNTVARLILTQLNACCRWALKEGLIEHNPFINMASELKRQGWSSEDIDPFSKAERDTIIQAYKDHKTHHHYYNFIRFLFYTGSRPGEACALRWRHVSDTSVLFNETYNARHHLTKETKTGKSRRFPINEQLRDVLNSSRATSSYSPQAYVFTTHHRGLPINNEKIPQLLRWREIVNKLVADGSVQRYRPPYACRSTFITMALDAGLTVSQVSKLVGNTPTVLLKHYASGNVSEIPVF